MNINEELIRLKLKEFKESDNKEELYKVLLNEIVKYQSTEGQLKTPVIKWDKFVKPQTIFY